MIAATKRFGRSRWAAATLRRFSVEWNASNGANATLARGALLAHNLVRRHVRSRRKPTHPNLNSLCVAEPPASGSTSRAFRFQPVDRAGSMASERHMPKLGHSSKVRNRCACPGAPAHGAAHCRAAVRAHYSQSCRHEAGLLAVTGACAAIARLLPSMGDGRRGVDHPARRGSGRHVSFHQLRT